MLTKLEINSKLMAGLQKSVEPLRETDSRAKLRKKNNIKRFLIYLLKEKQHSVKSM